MLFLFILVMNTEEYFWMKSYGWKHPAVIVYSVWENGAEITVSYPLDRIFNNDLPRGKFQRIHRSYAINVFKVTGFAGNYVHIGKKMLPVSESHKKNFLACFHKIYSKRALGK